MAEKNYISVVTDIGTEEIVKAVRNGGKVDIISFAVGDADGVPYRPTREMTALKNEVWRGEIVSYEILEESPNVIRVKALIPSEVGGFTMREMGLFDSQNNMIAIANTADIVKVRSVDGMQTEVEVAMRIAVTNTDVVVFEIDPNLVYVSQKDLQRHDHSVFSHRELREKILLEVAKTRVRRDIVIPNTGWVEMTEGGAGGEQYIDVMQEDVTEDMVPFVSIFPEHMTAARISGMNTVAETKNGGVRFYAEKAPTENINASLLLVKPYSGSAGGGIHEAYVYNVAEQEEIEEMLKEVFNE